MCTLSFLPNLELSGSFVVTSNRDEDAFRRSLPPKMYSELGAEMCYPKDELAGGTWIGASSKKRLACLMNGAFGPHPRKKEYRKSRGVLLKELLSAENTLEFMDGVVLEDIEPFTIIAVDWAEQLRLHQFLWDGDKKYLYELPVQPRIWSASMLYSQETRQRREYAFRDFLTENDLEYSPGQLRDFHEKFIIDRGRLKTTSITQFIRKGENNRMIYTDLQSGKQLSMKVF